MRRLLIDTDTASDDAVALVMALMADDAEVEAITVVAGNVPLDAAVQNALYTRELCGSDVPVHAGLAAPLLRDLETAQNVHGVDGMGDIGLPLSGRTADDGHAVDVLTDRIMSSDGSLTLVTLGPLSNVATALLKTPELARRVERCVVMGGAGAGPGNVSRLAEFNLWADPEAARIVFRSGLPLTMVGWDMSTRFATFSPAQAAEIRAIGTPLAEFTMDIQAVVHEYATTESHLDGFDLPDPIAMAVALEPECAVTAHHHVEIGIGDGHDRGKDIVDWLGSTGQEPNTEVAITVDRDRFVGRLRAAVGG